MPSSASARSTRASSRRSDTEIIGCFGGYCYLNASVTRILGVRTPGLTPEQMDYSLWGEMPGVPPYQPMAGDDDPSKTEAIQATLGWIFSAPELTDLEADRLRMADLRANRPDFDDDVRRGDRRWYRGHVPELRRLFAEHLYISYCSTVPLGVIQGVCTAIDDPTLAMTLVAGDRRGRLGGAVVRVLGDGADGARRRRRSPPRSTRA